MPKFHRHHHAGFAHHKGPFGGLIWLIGLPILFMTGFWWPGILILIGFSLIFNAILKQSWQPAFQEVQDNEQQPWTYNPPPAPAPAVRPAPVVTQASSAPASSYRRADLLPNTCPRCGGPVRAGEVKWGGPQSAACAYCGSILPMKKM